jgi:hypothetical protein
MSRTFRYFPIVFLCSLPGLPADLFQLSEMDLHLHAGMERQMDMGKWLDLSAADGRKVLVLLDHLELYRKTPLEYAAWRAKYANPPLYQLGAAGYREFIAQVKAAARERKDLLIFSGWEVSEAELDTGLDVETMRLADVIGWHISPNNGRRPPDGQSLLRRVEQIKKAQQQVPVPMILFHPFPMRIENIQRTAKAQGRDLKSITAGEYRFFHGNEQERLAAALKGTSIYVEMNLDTAHYWSDPACRQALIADILPLAKMGVQFTMATDAHGPDTLRKPFRPAEYCEALGCNPANSNGLVRELLARRRGR